MCGIKWKRLLYECAGVLMMCIYLTADSDEETQRYCGAASVAVDHRDHSLKSANAALFD